jgi:bacillopeptidase F (M6 metalloprotease family)
MKLCLWFCAAVVIPKAVAVLVPRQPSDPIEKDIVDYGYKTRLLNPELCRHLSEEACEELDTGFIDQAKKRRELQDYIGSIRVLVVLMQWSDHPSDKTLVPAAELREVWNGVGADDVIIPSGSIANYTRTNSHGKLELTAEVVDWIRTDNTEKYYADGRSGKSSSALNAVDLKEAFVPLLKQMDDSGFDFSSFDQDGDGTLDVTVFLHSGSAAEAGNIDCFNGAERIDRIQSQASGGLYDGWRSSSGKRLGSFVVASAYRGFCSTQLARIGTMVHELIHTFGIPDLYDLAGPYGNSASAVGGVGGYGIM